MEGDVFGNECRHYWHIETAREVREAYHEQAYDEFKEFIS